MPMKPIAALLLGLCLAVSALAAPAKPAPVPAAAAAPAALDQKRIHADYNEGNFEKVTAALEGFMDRNKTYSQADSVFIAKHLAVVYSANPGTREKGKYFMFRLLEMLPSAKLIDMYVSDEIDRIFDKVREEFVARQKSFGVDSAEITSPRKSPVTPVQANPETVAAKPAQSAPEKRKTSRTAYFVAGSAALVVTAGVVTYLMASDTPEKEEKIYEIP